ncbi:MAG: DUF3842 family protein [Lentisphaerae bacterium]|jgi:hypothetical protein|nr:DUF3842 family protein [Lentisphaerota bacterium]
MKILVIDAYGGGIGRQLVAGMKGLGLDGEIVAVGTNCLATQAMLKAGANAGATGENAIKVNCRDADVIVGPIGMVIADSMCGEISPGMALSIAQSPAVKIFIPFNLCRNHVVGIKDYNASALIAEALETIKSLAKDQNPRP